jgi:hypothetical protein
MVETKHQNTLLGYTGVSVFCSRYTKGKAETWLTAGEGGMVVRLRRGAALCHVCVRCWCGAHRLP